MFATPAPFWPVFGIAFVVAALLAPVIFRTLLALKSRQTVSQYVPEHAGKQGTPTMGGIIVGAGFVGAMLGVLLFGLAGEGADGPRRYFLAALLLFLVYALVGFVDDFVVPRVFKGKRGLGWPQKLVMQFAGAGLFLLILGRPMAWEQAAFGVLAILFFANAYNFSDGLDALAGSLLLALSLGLGIVASFTDPGQLVLLGALCGAALPFLWLNRPPAKIFMGDVGSLPIGAVLGVTFTALLVPGWRIAEPSGVVAAIGQDVPKFAPLLFFLGLGIVSFVMIAELVPVPLQILSVKLRKKRLFPMTPIHHAFQKAGWKETKVVVLFVSVQLVCSLVGAFLAYSVRSNLSQDRVALESPTSQSTTWSR